MSGAPSSAPPGLASGDRRHDRQIVAVLQRRLEPRPEPNVLVVPVDVDELPKLALVVIEPLPEARIFLVQLIQRLRDVTGVYLNDGRPPRELTQRPGHANFDRHVVVIISRYAPRPGPSPCGEGRVGLVYAARTSRSVLPRCATR